MGQVVSILGAIERLDCCGTWAKYVYNAAHCHSKCGECCDVELETQKVDVSSDSDGEMEVEVDGRPVRLIDRFADPIFGVLS